MTDRLSKEQRTLCMSHIKGKDTGPEMIVRKFLFSRGFRYRLNVTRLPGKPDIVLRKYSTVIFIDGCFWHGHENCKYATLPQSNTAFWSAKISRNKERDVLVAARLRQMGWNVLRIWECDLKPSNRDKTLEGLLDTLRYMRVAKTRKIAPYELIDDVMCVAEDRSGYSDDDDTI